MTSLQQNELEAMESWASAMMNSKGYEAKELVKDLAHQFKNSLGARLHFNGSDSIEPTVRRAHLIQAWTLFISQTDKSEITVCDVGGGNGYMFDWISQSYRLENKKILNTAGDPIQVNWNVYESEAIANAYQGLKGKLPISFIPNLESNYPNKIDFALLSCFIQYVDNWEDTLSSIGAKSEYLLLMRLPLVESNTHREFVQHLFSDVYGKSKASWPIRLFSENEFMRFISKSFEVVYSGDDKEETIPFEGRDYPLKTLFLKKR